jgi:hypothetical protein
VCLSFIQPVNNGSIVDAGSAGQQEDVMLNDAALPVHWQGCAHS